ncbi:hypothetical protein DCAR_0519367 [Daucus carota subsp. sativus]|uniref:Diacylglycerol O-acyltransferase n=1 Tax=Daucus carota subsp. sativus TaxID=79200 RepID=A0AAF0X1E0_DAUCS|nr:PREDICTED: O-acyltransferase WSD1-like [Daucus carota subsp. sativus]WOH00011.1 hypothetical protein DCAR_0519367 [Daucus carota subsp. sativus]
MEYGEEEPVSPTGQYMSSSVLNLITLAFLEFQVPIDDLQILDLIKDQFLPINPRFSSKMAEDESGLKKWKRVEVDLQEHVKIPKFPPSEFVYDEYLDEYVAEISMNPLSRTRPLWEIHVIKYKTSNAAATVIFKLHQALGDGYSLIGALLSTLKRADDPSLPLTFPSRQSSSKVNQNNAVNILKRATKVFSGIVDTVLDFGGFLVRGEDDPTPIRSGKQGVEFQQLEYTTLTFSLDQIRQVKDILKVTVNDLIMGIILYGIRVYMRGEKHESMKAAATAMLLFNTRSVEGGYNSVSEMLKRDSAMPWGNQITATHVNIPKLMAKTNSYSELEEFVLKIHESTQRKKNSSAIFLTGLFIDGVRKFKGSEAAARFIHSDIRKSSLVLSNLIGPMEQMALADHPVKGLYFTFSGAPLSLGMNVISYMGNLRVAIASEKGFIDQLKLKACVQEAFDTIFASLL